MERYDASNQHNDSGTGRKTAELTSMKGDESNKKPPYGSSSAIERQLMARATHKAENNANQPSRDKSPVRVIEPCRSHYGLKFMLALILMLASIAFLIFTITEYTDFDILKLISVDIFRYVELQWP